MRNNQPVSDQEHVLPADATLVSVTDLKGRIVYGNPTFITVSGYVREELMGQPHNIIRHPDVPAEAFRDLWATLEAGKPWRGIVKNRRKNGDHYWVEANAIPILRDDRTVGYLSVRTVPTREQIGAAQALYDRMNAEQAQGRLTLGLHRGLPRPVQQAPLACRGWSRCRRSGSPACWPRWWNRWSGCR